MTSCQNWGTGLHRPQFMPRLLAWSIDFVVLINDLRSDCPLCKFIDDTTYSEVLTASQTSNMQTYYNELQQWSADNFMQVNASKTKEMVIGK